MNCETLTPCRTLTRITGCLILIEARRDMEKNVVWVFIMSSKVVLMSGAHLGFSEGT